MRSSKNESLIKQLDRNKYNFCIVGLRRTKLFLNSLIKNDKNEKAYILRQLLEIECANINAKKYFNTTSFSYQDMYYKEKHVLINDLLKHLLEHNPYKVIYGRDNSDVFDTKYIVYFKSDFFDQISFHSDIDAHILKHIDKFPEKWDGRINSTLKKLEKSILSIFEPKLREKYKKEFFEYDEEKRKEMEREEKNKAVAMEAINKMKDDYSYVFNFTNEEIGVSPLIFKLIENQDMKAGIEKLVIEKIIPDVDELYGKTKKKRNKELQKAIDKTYPNREYLKRYIHDHIDRERKKLNKK